MTIFAAPPRLATALDRAGGRVGAPHERHRAGRRPAALQVLLRRADLRQVHSGARAALEDDPLLPVPVEDRVHRVVDGEDEAGARLLRHALDADVEPHRAVERRPLVDDQVLELGPEGLGLLGVGEVAVLLAPGGDRVDDPVGDLLQAPLPLGGAEGSPEVLLGEDVRGVDRPGGRHLDAELLERDRAVPVVGDARHHAAPR